MITIATASPTGKHYDNRGDIVQAHGYIRKQFLMSDSELTAARQGLVDASRVHQFELAAIYIEEVETAPDAFHNLLAAVMQGTERNIIIPGLHHFAVVGQPEDVRKRLESNGIQIFLARHAD